MTKRIIESKLDSVNRLDSWFSSDYCAAVTWGGHVKLFSISQSRFVADIFTHKDSGGISVALSGDDLLGFVGTYYAWGLACFEIATGKQIWKRSDLKHFYGLSYSQTQGSLFGYFNGKSGLRIDPHTGKTLETLRDCKHISCSPFDGCVLIRGGKKVRLVSKSEGVLWNCPASGFAALDVAWSPTLVVLSEAGSDCGGGVRCFEISTGKLRWSNAEHCINIMYCPGTQQFVGIGGKKGLPSLMCFRWEEETGDMNITEIPKLFQKAICNKGQLIYSIEPKSFESSLMKI